MNVEVYYAIYPLKNGKPKWKRSRSFLKNFCIAFKMIIGGSTGRTAQYVESGAKDVNGSNVNIVDSTTASYRSFGRLPQIHVGVKDNPSPPMPDDYKLEQEIAAFSASSTPAEGASVTVSGNQSLFDYVAIATFTEDTIVTEIGLSTLLLYSANAETRLMLVRDVLSPPITIPANTPYVIRYRFIMEA